MGVLRDLLVLLFDSSTSLCKDYLFTSVFLKGFKKEIPIKLLPKSNMLDQYPSQLASKQRLICVSMLTPSTENSS